MIDNFLDRHATNYQVLLLFSMFVGLFIGTLFAIERLSEDMDELAGSTVRIGLANHKRLTWLEEIITTKTQDATNGTD